MLRDGQKQQQLQRLQQQKEHLLKEERVENRHELAQQDVALSFPLYSFCVRQ